MIRPADDSSNEPAYDLDLTTLGPDTPENTAEAVKAAVLHLKTSPNAFLDSLESAKSAARLGMTVQSAAEALGLGKGIGGLLTNAEVAANVFLGGSKLASALEAIGSTSSLAGRLDALFADQAQWELPAIRHDWIFEPPTTRLQAEVAALRDQVAELEQKLDRYHEKDQELRQHIAETHLGVKRMSRGYEPGTAPLFSDEPSEDS